MKTTPLKSYVCILVLVISLFGNFHTAYACGPFSRYAIFSFTKHPDMPLDKYARGELGVIEQSYARSYLYVAYRLMRGGSFDEQERQALTKLWNERLDFSQGRTGEDASAAWIAARQKVMGAGADPKLDVYRTTAPKEYEYFLNCPDDAFKNATKTLEERISKLGATSAEVKDWVTAQDQVFSNCAEGQTIPQPASGSASASIQADRAYQIAAAHFYAMNFDEAKSHFEKIASDAASPWHEQADYLVARTLIRKATLGEEARRKEILAQAETQLRKVLSEAKPDALRKSAQNLLHLVRTRLQPAESMRELSQSLLKKEANANLYQELWDYTILLDRYTGDSDAAADEALKKALDAAEKDDLTDWLLTFQADAKDSLEHSLEKWEKSNSIPWLIASLSKIDAKHAKTASLIAAAERIEIASPAYATAQFHLSRLLTDKGDRTGAQRRLDAMLQSQPNMPASAANHFRHLRMLLADNLDDFLKYAQRQPAAFSWDDDGRENPIDIKDDEELKTWAGRALLDVDSTLILNGRFPLSLLGEAAVSKTLPEHIRREIALAAWTRAAVLDDVENGKALATLSITLAPELKQYLNPYLAATSEAERKAAALYAILKNPGLHITVSPSTGRLSPLGERDIYRDNWWCQITDASHAPSEATEDTESSTGKARQEASSLENVALAFLSEAQNAAAKRERAQLMQLGTAPNYLSREAIAWATKAPDDPRVPEALHIAITSTRYGCTDKETGKWSKAAFELLHKRYPRSPWAKKTPYWFNEGG